MGDSNVELVKGVYEAFARGDLAAALAAMADDIEWHEADGGPYAGVHRSPAQVAAKVLRPVAGDVPDFAATPEEVIPSGRTVAVIGRYTGTGRATGMKLDLPVVHIWDVITARSPASASSSTVQRSRRSWRPTTARPLRCELASRSRCDRSVTMIGTARGDRLRQWYSARGSCFHARSDSQPASSSRSCWSF